MATLVTGAAGFLGSYVMSALAAAGEPAHGYDVSAPSGDALAVAPGLAGAFSLGRVTDAARLFDVCGQLGVDAMVHAAGLVGLEGSLEQPVAYYETNVMGFVQVCEAARQAGARRVVLVSSNAAYHAPSGAKLVEGDPVFSVERGNPAGHYGTSKMMQEAVGLAYADFHGLDVVMLRVTAIYGFGMRSPMYIKPMVEDAVAGRPTRLPQGGPMRRDYTYVLDCAGAVLHALAAPANRPSPRVLNVSAGHAATAAEVAAVVRAVIPGADIQIGDGLTPLEAANNRMRAPLDVSAAARAIGWSPAWPLADGIRDYARRLRAHRAGHGAGLQQAVGPGPNGTDADGPGAHWPDGRERQAQKAAPGLAHGRALATSQGGSGENENGEGADRDGKAADSDLRAMPGASVAV